MAVTSFVLYAWCRCVDFSYRTDMTDVLAWIEDTVGPAAWAEVEVVTV